MSKQGSKQTDPVQKVETLGKREQKPTFVAQLMSGFSDPVEFKDPETFKDLEDFKKKAHQTYSKEDYERIAASLYSKIPPKEFFNDLLEAYNTLPKDAKNQNQKIFLNNALLLISEIISNDIQGDYKNEIHEGVSKFVAQALKKADENEKELIAEFRYKITVGTLEVAKQKEQRNSFINSLKEGPSPRALETYAPSMVNDVASDLKAINLKLFMQTKPSEFYNKKWEQDPDCALSKLSSNWNLIGSMVKTDLLLSKNEKDFSKVYEFYVKLANQSFKMGDFITASAIVTHLNTSDISRISDKLKVKKEIKDTLTKLQTYFDRDDIARDKLNKQQIKKIESKKSPTSVIPLHTKPMSDIAIIYEKMDTFGNVVKLPESNKVKLRETSFAEIGHVIVNHSNYQKKNFELEKGNIPVLKTDIQKRLENKKFLTDMDAKNMSDRIKVPGKNELNFGTDNEKEKLFSQIERRNEILKKLQNYSIEILEKIAKENNIPYEKLLPANFSMNKDPMGGYMAISFLNPQLGQKNIKALGELFRDYVLKDILKSDFVEFTPEGVIKLTARDVPNFFKDKITDEEFGFLCEQFKVEKEQFGIDKEPRKDQSKMQEVVAQRERDRQSIPKQGVETQQSLDIPLEDINKALNEAAPEKGEFIRISDQAGDISLEEINKALGPKEVQVEQEGQKTQDVEDPFGEGMQSYDPTVTNIAKKQESGESITKQDLSQEDMEMSDEDPSKIVSDLDKSLAKLLEEVPLEKEIESIPEEEMPSKEDIEDLNKSFAELLKVDNELQQEDIPEEDIGDLKKHLAEVLGEVPQEKESTIITKQEIPKQILDVPQNINQALQEAFQAKQENKKTTQEDKPRIVKGLVRKNSMLLERSKKMQEKAREKREAEQNAFQMGGLSEMTNTLGNKVEVLNGAVNSIRNNLDAPLANEPVQTPQPQAMPQVLQVNPQLPQNPNQNPNPAPPLQQDPVAELLQVPKTVTYAKDEKNVEMLHRADLLKIKENYFLNEENYNIYVDKFKTSPIQSLITLMQENKNIKDLLPYISFITNGLRQECVKNEITPQLNARLMVLEQLQSMIKSIDALERNNSRYTQAQYSNQWHKLEALLEKQNPPLTPSEMLGFEKSVEGVVNHHLYTRKSLPSTGFTRFDTTQEKQNLSKYGLSAHRAIKVEHEASGKLVNLSFSYNRSTLFSDIPFGKKEQMIKMTNQVRDALLISMNEYGKGSSTNPISITYRPPALKQPEVALSLLRALKERAILEGKEFFVLDPISHQKVTITPKAECGPQETACFRHFANEKPTHKGKLFSKTASEVSKTAGEILKINPDKLSDIFKEFQDKVNTQQEESKFSKQLNKVSRNSPSI